MRLTVSAVLVAIAVISGGSSRAAASEGIGPSIVVVSSIDDSSDGHFVMTATNIGDEPVSLVHRAPASGPVTVDTGSWDGTRWSVLVTPGTTATMTGG